MCKYVGVRLFTFTNLKNKVVLAIRVMLVIRRLQLKEEEINKRQKEKRRLRKGEASAEESKQLPFCGVCMFSPGTRLLQTHAVSGV